MVEDQRECIESHSERWRVNSALGFGTAFSGGMAVFSIAGHWLDVKFDKVPLFTLIGISLGFIFGGWELWKLVIVANRSISDEDRKDESNGEEASYDSTN